MQRYDFFLNLQHFTRNYFVKHELRGMAVAEDFGESGGRIVLEMLPSFHNTAFVGIGQDGGFVFDDADAAAMTDEDFFKF